MLPTLFPNKQHVLAQQPTNRLRPDVKHANDADDNARVVDYWNRRSALDAAEWTDFYHRVIPLLMRTRLPERYNEEAERRGLINDFFQDKILLNAETSQAGPLQNAHALHIYLKNYEKDVRRKDLWEESLDALCEDDGFQPGAGAADETYCDPHANLLDEAGIDAGAAMRSADHFVATLELGELAYLRHHSCNDDKPEPVSRIAERLALGTAFHFKAKKLGITRSKGETYRGYEKTKIGAWLLSVGAQLHPDWREELATLLILLCQQVRLRVREVR